MSKNPHRDTAERIFDGPPGPSTVNLPRTRGSIVEEIAKALEAAHAEGLRLGALGARETALRESRHIVAGLLATLTMHDRTLEIELNAAIAQKKNEQKR